MLILRQEAERDLSDAHAWYEERMPGLGSSFLAATERTLEAIEREPGRFPRVRGDIRRALMRRFPYGVFFIWEEERISVIAIMHLARDPGKWRRRA